MPKTDMYLINPEILLEVNIEELLTVVITRLSKELVKRIKNRELNNKAYRLFRYIILLRGETLVQSAKQIQISRATLENYLHGKFKSRFENKIIDYLSNISNIIIKELEENK